jgi:translation initiation factor IF-1
MLAIIIQNDGTGTKKTGNYNYSVQVNDKVIAKGRIKGHKRIDRWMELVQAIVNIEREKETMELAKFISECSMEENLD